jgi:hypothetical protein
LRFGSIDVEPVDGAAGAQKKGLGALLLETRRSDEG